MVPRMPGVKGRKRSIRSLCFLFGLCLGRFSLNVQGNPAGIFKLAEGVMTGQVRSLMEANLTRLKSVLERAQITSKWLELGLDLSLLNDYLNFLFHFIQGFS